MTEHEIGHLREFPEGRATRVQVDGIDVAVFNLDGELYGIQNTCPHKKLPLHVTGEERPVSQTLVAEGYYDLADDEKCPDEDIRGGINRDELTINCPWHYLEWDLECGENEQMDVRIATYDLTVEDDGSVWIEV